MATGSLGQGLPIGVGVALAGKRLDRLPYRVWVLCGDSELAEGSMWEAFEHAAYDGARQPRPRSSTSTGSASAARRCTAGTSTRTRGALEAFGWRAIEIDGHDVEAIDRAYAEALVDDRPPDRDRRAHDEGQGRRGGREQDGWHGKALDDREEAIAELGGVRDIVVDVHEAASARREPHAFEPARSSCRATSSARRSRRARPTARRSLRSARARGDVVALDGEVANSTYAEIFAKAHPGALLRDVHRRAAAGRGRGRHAGARLDAVRLDLRGVLHARLRLHPHGGDLAAPTSGSCGSHAGVSIGEDGPSQMALEDLAMLRAVHGSTVLYPCDANQTAQLVAAMADLDGHLATCARPAARRR